MTLHTVSKKPNQQNMIVLFAHLTHQLKGQMSAQTVLYFFQLTEYGQPT